MGAALGWRRKLLPPMPRNIDPSAEPDIVMARDMLDKPLERLKAAGAPDQSAMEADIHQAGRLCALFVEHVETVAQVSEKGLSPIEPRRGGEPMIVDISRIRNDELLLAALGQPVG